MRSAGQVIADRYEIQRHVGSGGMGEVYLALDRTLGRRVAVKVLPPDAEGDPVARERLRREARAAAALDHPFICKIHEVGESEGHSFIVMEYIEGDTLHQLASAQALPVRQVLDLTHALAQALEEAHNRGITHRDLKPGNIMVTRQGHVKVLDFGLAKQVTESAATESTGGGTMLTDPGTRVGTPAYMSPEQILGGSIDPRSDIFSLGVILHEIVSGVHPFKRETPSETMAAVLRDPPSTDGRDLEAVPGLRDVVHRMLSKACAERYQSMGELRAEIEALRERSWLSTPGATPAGAARPSLPAERTPFVARDAELAELRGALDHMLLGKGGIVLIGGEPGVGKTRLVRELQREAHQRGCITLTGHCYEMEGAPPFVPFVEYLEEIARLIPKAFRAALGDEAGEIATIVPGLRRLYPDIPPPLDVPADQQRRVSFNAFLEFLRRGTAKSPSVILFDDLHWADEPTVQLIHHIAPHLTSMRTLMVGTYRDVELDVKKPFARALETLVRQRLARRINLRRLPAEDVERMLTRMSGSPAPSSVVKVVFQETEGNPFFIEEVYQHLSEEGRLFDGQGQWRGDLRADTLDVPESVKLVIGRRLERLGEETRKILAAGAAIGRVFPLDVLQAIVDVDGDAVLDALEAAEQASLLSTHPGREVRYGFVHELIRTTLISNLSLPRRQRLHLRIADAIETLRGGANEAHVQALSHHLYQAGAAADLDRTAGALARAALQTHASGAFEEVIEICENLISLDLAGGSPHLATATECRGYALQALGRTAEARTVLEAAFQLFTRQEDVSGIERATSALSASYVYGGDLEQACHVIRRGLTHLPPSARGTALLRAQLPVSLSGLGNFDEAEAEIEELRHTAESSGDDLLMAHVLFCEAWLCRLAARFEQGVRCGQRAFECPPLPTEAQRIDFSWNHALGLYYCGRLAEAEPMVEQVEKDARRFGRPGAMWVMSVTRLNMRLMREGNLEAAIAGLRDLSNERWDFLTRHLSGVLNAYLGHEDAARDAFVEVASTQQQNYLAGIGVPARFASAALAGHTTDALVHFDDAMRWLPAETRFNGQGRWSAAMSVISGLAFLGDRERLATLDPLGRRLAAQFLPVDSFSVGPTNSDLSAGLTAAAAGDPARAAHHYERALAMARSAPNMLLEPMAQYWYGRLELETGRADSGRHRLHEAIARFTKLKMLRHVELATRAVAG